VTGRIWRQRNIRTAFGSAVEAAGLKDFHFHDLRHHFASWYIMRGGSLPSLQQILGHADLKMTLRYAHLAPEHLRSEIAKTERPAQSAAALAPRPGADFRKVQRKSPVCGRLWTGGWRDRSLSCCNRLVPKRGLEPRHPCGH
jgi:hypothetical protein